jgi:hypothetical protein
VASSPSTAPSALDSTGLTSSKSLAVSDVPSAPIKRKRGRLAKQHRSISSCTSPNEENLLTVFNFDDSFFIHDEESSEYQSLLNNHDTLLPDEDSDSPWLSDIAKFADKNPEKLKMCHLNVNSIFNKLFEIYKIIERGLFDIISIQETKLGPEIPDNLFAFTNYTTLRRDRQRGGGGLMVFIK